MYVKKFQSETLDGALKEIKNDLGPDAIILKTVTNKGLKGAFKKKKIEITAAISEKNYLKKAKVDTVLDKNQKETFYSDNAGQIANMIDHYDVSQEKQQLKQTQTYGKMGLNRSVKKSAQKGLDDFLNGPSANKEKENVFEEQKMEVKDTSNDELEKRVLELERKIESLSNNDLHGTLELKTTLRSLEIDEKCVQEIIKKCLTRFSKNELNNIDLLYEFTLKEMLSTIKTGRPLFSGPDTDSLPAVTLFLSDSQCGQSSIVKKLAVLNKGSVIIDNNNFKDTSLVKEIYDIESIKATSFSEIVSNTRKYTEEGRSVFIDYKNTNKDFDDIKKIVKGMSKAFSNVEILICISSIHSEVYNRKILSKYHQISDGAIITNLDLCLNYGSIFNIAYNFSETPLKFFGTGDVIPDDIEAATGERIMAGIFNLD